VVAKGGGEGGGKKKKEKERGGKGKLYRVGRREGSKSALSCTFNLQSKALIPNLNLYCLQTRVLAVPVGEVKRGGEGAGGKEKEGGGKQVKDERGQPSNLFNLLR